MKRFAVLIVIVFSVFECAAPAFGALTIFDSRASFEAATTGRTVVDFENIAPDNGWQYVSSPPGITLNGVNFSQDSSISDCWMYVIGKNYYFPGNSVLSPQGSTTAQDSVLATMPGSFTAVGMDYGVCNLGISSTFTFKLSTGETFSRINVGGPTMDFFGVVSTTPMTSVTIAKSTGYAENIDNFTFGTAVPEPSTLLLLGMSVISLIFAWRRRNR